MIRLTTAPPHTGAEGPVLINIDNILLCQRQTPVQGEDFTAVFINMENTSPFRVTETVDQIYAKICEAQFRRSGGQIVQKPSLGKLS